MRRQHRSFVENDTINQCLLLDDNDDNLTLREKSNKKNKGLAVRTKLYIIMALCLLVIYIIDKFSHDLGMNLYSELAGLGFAIFVIDRLINYEKERRWKIVHKSIDYLIGRSVNRIRDALRLEFFHSSQYSTKICLKKKSDKLFGHSEKNFSIVSPMIARMNFQGKFRI